MNINGTKLIDSEGMVADVKSSYNHARKTGYAWDIELSPPDETKNVDSCMGLAALGSDVRSNNNLLAG